MGREPESNPGLLETPPGGELSSDHCGKSNHWEWPAPSVLPWIVPALTSLYLKYSLMKGGMLAAGTGGFKVAAHFLGKQEGFTLWEKLSFFRTDTLVAVFIALALIVLARYLPPRWRVLIIAVLSAGVTLALYAQLRAFQEVGQFISLRMFLAAFSWAWREPGAYAAYLGIKELLTLLGAVVLIAGVLWWLVKRDEEILREPHIQRGWATAGSTVVFCLLSVVILPRLPRVPSTPFHAGVLLRALNAYWGEGEVENREFAGLTTPELLSRYRELTHAPASQRNPDYWGKAKGSNVLYFVFETLPARFLPAEQNLDDLPNLRRLRDNSIVAMQHYTPYPITHQALFSLLSAWYPSGVMRSFEEQHPDMVVPSIMRTLSARSYHTAVYSPDPFGNFLDSEMFRALGVQQLIFSPPTHGDTGTWQTTRKARDLAALNLMKEDLERWLTEGQRFAAVFLPQIGHGPWSDAPKDGDEKGVWTRERAILATQDAWLGELLQLLERHHQLDQTVIIITGDHGVRGRQEDPGFVGGVIDEYSFHVPLLIYASQASDRMMTISWLTSHIDVAPTVLDLLGIEEGREFEQGTPIWNADLAKRKTYFFANAMFGADGYYSDGRFYMWNHMSDSVYVSPQPHFETSDLVPETSLIHREVSRSVARMVGLQQAWATHFGQAKAVRNHLFDR